jgi:hypothetical protein
MKRPLSKLCSVILEGEDALYPQASNDHYCCRFSSYEETLQVSEKLYLQIKKKNILTQK